MVYSKIILSAILNQWLKQFLAISFKINKL